MISLTYDFMFKSVFERQPKLLKEFLIDTLELEINPDDVSIEILKNELPKEKFNEYQKKVDIIVNLDNNKCIDIEMNRSRFEKVKLRNVLYFSKIYSLFLETGDKTTKLKDIILYQLNLNTKDIKTKYPSQVIVPYNFTTKEIYASNQITILKYLALYRNLYYTNHENMSKGEIWLAALTAETFTELDEILSHILDDEKREKLVNEVRRMSKNEFNLCNWEAEKMAELSREESRRVDYEEGMEFGLEQGEKNKTMQMIHEMLNENIDISVIAKVSGKSIEEIEEIKNNK